MRNIFILMCLFVGLGCSTPRQYFKPDSDLPFSNAVLSGNTLYVAGHLGLDPNTGKAPSDPAEEVTRLLDAFEKTLGRAGYTMDDLVQVQVHCSDISLYDTFNAAYRKRFKTSFPARAFIGSGTLLREARFEMIGVAVK